MKTNEKILLGIAAGAIIGGLLGVMFASDKGRAARVKLSMKGKKLFGDIEEELGNLKEQFMKGCDEKPATEKQTA